MLVAVRQVAITYYLAVVVDAIGETAFAQRPQVGHHGIHHGERVLIPARQARESHHFAVVVNARGLAVGSAKSAQQAYAAIRAPNDRLKCSVGQLAVAHHGASVVDSVGRAPIEARLRRQVLHLAVSSDKRFAISARHFAGIIDRDRVGAGAELGGAGSAPNGSVGLSVAVRSPYHGS